MSHIPELRFGYAGYANQDSSGRAPIEASAFDPSGYDYGVPCSAFRAFRITPLTIQGANVAALQTPAAAGALTLAAGTGAVATTINIQGQVLSVIDITGGAFSRGLQIVGQGGVTARNYTITGYDEYNMLTTALVAGPNGAQTILTTKCWRYIQSITVSGGTSAAVSIGTSDVYGLPVAVFSWDYFLGLYWNNTLITASTGFVAADTTSPATASTGHVRGTYQIQADTSNGSKTLSSFIHMSSINAANMNTAYGVIPA